MGIMINEKVGAIGLPLFVFRKNSGRVISPAVFLRSVRKRSVTPSRKY